MADRLVAVLVMRAVRRGRKRGGTLRIRRRRVKQQQKPGFKPAFGRFSEAMLRGLQEARVSGVW